MDEESEGEGEETDDEGVEVSPVVPQQKPCINSDSEAGTDTGRCNGIACVGLDGEDAAGCYTKHRCANTADFFMRLLKSGEGKGDSRRHSH